MASQRPEMCPGARNDDEVAQSEQRDSVLPTGKIQKRVQPDDEVQSIAWQVLL
jgi:hypothetical protein